MNLLKDPWIPVQDQGGAALITLEQVLCSNDDYRIALPRDDLELACLQLMICLTQVLFPPEDKKALLARLRQPMSPDEYAEGIQPFIDWFDLRHEQWPFMQVRGVKASKETSIQKLFPGLPAGDGSHTFFTDASEVVAVSEPVAAIALFNQASNAPSFGGGNRGGFKYGLRGVPITTFIYQQSLRHTVWSNILHINHIQSKIIPGYVGPTEDDKPTWVDLIKEKSEVPASSIGLLRGLFWQPAHIELIFEDASATCDFLGINTETNIAKFYTNQFGFKTDGTWAHPHSPRIRKLNDNSITFLSFKTTAPAWTQLNHLLVASEDRREGHDPAEVVQQFKRDLARPSQLIVGGYHNKQATILERRHELFPLKPGWETGDEMVRKYVSSALEIKQILRK